MCENISRTLWINKRKREYPTADCVSKMMKFRSYNGKYVQINEKNRLGKGGFGVVCSGLWHGKESAFKFIEFDTLQSNGQLTKEIKTKYEKNIKEYRTQFSAAGAGWVRKHRN